MISQFNPEACPECLRRARLLAHLAPYIEKIATGAPGRRSPELLRLGNEDLPRRWRQGKTQVLAGIAAVPDARLREEHLAAESWACCRHYLRFPGGLADAPRRPGRCSAAATPPAGAPGAGEAVTVVGARRATTYGREVARELGSELAAAGIVVVSGLAFGIDACAHRGRARNGLTVAVLGCGADVAYPAAHRSLWRRIGENGLVLSELPPGNRRLALDLPGPQPDHGRARRDDGRRRGGRALRLADHRRPGRGSRPRPGRRARPGRLPALGRAQQPARRRRPPGARRPGRARRDARPGSAPDGVFRAGAGPRSASVSSKGSSQVRRRCDSVALGSGSRAAAAASARRPRAARLLRRRSVGTYSRTTLPRPKGGERSPPSLRWVSDKQPPVGPLDRRL